MSRNVRAVLIVAAIAAVIGVSLILIRINASGNGPPPGDSVAVPTAPRPDGEGCRLASITGTLVTHPVWVVALQGENEPQLVFWPRGWSARLTDEGADLLNRQGRVAAHTGDLVTAAGGLAKFGGREGIAVCATDLHFEPANP